MQPSSFASTILRVAALLVILVGLASQKHAVTTFGDRATFATVITSCFHCITEKEIDAAAAHPFVLSQKEWKIFKVFQEADVGCECGVICYDNNSHVWTCMYMTFDHRPRLKDEWNGWDCDATRPSNTQQCGAWRFLATPAFQVLYHVQCRYPLTSLRVSSQQTRRSASAPSLFVTKATPLELHHAVNC